MDRMKQTTGVMLVAVLIMAIGVSCSMTLGSDGSGSGDSGGTSGPGAEEQYRETVKTEVAGLDASSTPQDVYAAALTIDASRSAHGIETSAAIAILDEEMDPGQQRDLIVAVIESGYTLQDVQSAMTGVYSDPDSGITTALTLDDNVDGTGDVQVTGDVSWEPGVDGSALSIDAEGEYISVADSPAVDLLSDEASIEVWIYPTQTIEWAGILHKGTAQDFSDEAYSLQYWFDELGMLFVGPDGKYTVMVADQPAPATDRWHHVAVTWNQSGASLYLNGQAVSTVRYYRDGQGWIDASELPDDWTHLPDSDGDLLIGSQPTQGSPAVRFDGRIDNVKLYDRMLTPEEIEANWQALDPN